MDDLLAICAHPDDLEVGLGGTFLKAKKHGLKTGLIILTRGEAGGHADQGTREKEAERGAEAMRLDYFRMLDEPDSRLYNTDETVKKLIPYLREADPRYIFTLLAEDYHPDHVQVSRLTESACFSAGLSMYSVDKTEWHYENIFYFSADLKTNKRRPDIYIDISDIIDEKLRVCSMHYSQGVDEAAEKIGKAAGLCAGVSYAEGIYLRASVTIDSVEGLFKCQ